MIKNKGDATAYAWDPAVTWPWRWQDLVAQMNRESIETVVFGDNPNRDPYAKSIYKCSLHNTGKYDHKPHHAANKEKRPIDSMLTQWAFVFERTDGTKCSVTPAFSSTNIGFNETAVAVATEIPKSGLGGTSGPGTYTAQKRANVTMVLKFDTSLCATRTMVRTSR